MRGLNEITFKIPGAQKELSSQESMSSSAVGISNSMQYRDHEFLYRLDSAVYKVEIVLFLLKRFQILPWYFVLQMLWYSFVVLIILLLWQKLFLMVWWQPGAMKRPCTMGSVLPLCFVCKRAQVSLVCFCHPYYNHGGRNPGFFTV